MAKVISGARGKFLKNGEVVGYAQSVTVAGEDEREVNFEGVRLVKGYSMRDLCETKLQVINKNDVSDILEEVEIERVYGHGTINLVTGHHKIIYSNKETQ